MMLFFFFSSRRRHTRCLSDWSSDVCSSDLLCDGWARDEAALGATMPLSSLYVVRIEEKRIPRIERLVRRIIRRRSEERRVGKECSSRWSPDPEKTKKANNKSRNASADRDAH